MTLPTLSQIQAEGEALAATLGNGVHLRGTDLALTVDAKFPGMSDEEMADVRAQCVGVADAIRTEALTKMWGN